LLQQVALETRSLEATSKARALVCRCQRSCISPRPLPLRCRHLASCLLQELMEVPFSLCRALQQALRRLQLRCTQVGRCPRQVQELLMVRCITPRSVRQVWRPRLLHWRHVARCHHQVQERRTVRVSTSRAVYQVLRPLHRRSIAVARCQHQVQDCQVDGCLQELAMMRFCRPQRAVQQAARLFPLPCIQVARCLHQLQAPSRSRRNHEGFGQCNAASNLEELVVGCHARSLTSRLQLRCIQVASCLHQEAQARFGNHMNLADPGQCNTATQEEPMVGFLACSRTRRLPMQRPAARCRYQVHTCHRMSHADSGHCKTFSDLQELMAGFLACSRTRRVPRRCIQVVRFLAQELMAGFFPCSPPRRLPCHCIQVAACLHRLQELTGILAWAPDRLNQPKFQCQMSPEPLFHRTLHRLQLLQSAKGQQV